MRLSRLSLLVLALSAGPAAADSYSVTCAGSRQIGGGLTSCEGMVQVTLTSDGGTHRYDLVLAAPASHCSDVLYQISGPGLTNGAQTPVLRPGASARVYLAKDLPAGPQTYVIRALGKIGGCNSGTMSSWGVEVTPRISP